MESIVRIVKLPPRIKGLTVIDKEGCANIYISDALNFETKQVVLRHELKHVERDDAYNDLPIEQAEGLDGA